MHTCDHDGCSAPVTVQAMTAVDCGTDPADPVFEDINVYFCAEHALACKDDSDIYGFMPYRGTN